MQVKGIKWGENFFFIMYEDVRTFLETKKSIMKYLGSSVCGKAMLSVL